MGAQEGVTRVSSKPHRQVRMVRGRSQFPLRALAGDNLIDYRLHAAQGLSLAFLRWRPEGRRLDSATLWSEGFQQPQSMPICITAQENNRARQQPPAKIPHLSQHRERY